MSWQERQCNAEGFGRPEPFFFLCEERTYSPPRRSKLRIVRFRLRPKAHSLRCFSFPHKAGFAGPPFAAVVSLPLVRVVRSARRMRLLREPPDNALAPAVLLSSSAVLKVVWVKMAHPTSAPCVNLPPAALSQLWTVLAARPFSFSEKKQKQGYAVSAYPGKDVIYYGDLSSGSKGRKPWIRSKCLRCGGIYELFRHL